MYFYATSVMVRPDECQAITGIYGVVPDATGTVIRACGDSHTDECVYNESTLGSAMSKCNELGKTCEAFTYSEKTGDMKVVALDINPPYSPGVNLYRRRVETLLVGVRSLRIG